MAALPYFGGALFTTSEMVSPPCDGLDPFAGEDNVGAATFRVEPSALASVPDIAVALGATGAGELLLQLVTAVSRHSPTAKHASFTFIRRYSANRFQRMRFMT
jgi:hypothetical protein